VRILQFVEKHSPSTSTVESGVLSLNSRYAPLHRIHEHQEFYLVSTFGNWGVVHTSEIRVYNSFSGSAQK
jgi:hypothetical protein